MQCTIENRGLFMENNIKEESRLMFQFAENDTVIKFDDTKFYRDYFNKLPGAKGVDFISVAKDKIAFIEVKNCTGDEGNNRWRIVPDNRKRNTTHTSINVEGRDSLELGIDHYNAQTIDIGLIAVLTDVKTPNFEEVVKQMMLGDNEKYFKACRGTVSFND